MNVPSGLFRLSCKIFFQEHVFDFQDMDDGTLDDAVSKFNCFASIFPGFKVSSIYRSNGLDRKCFDILCSIIDWR